MLRAVFRSYLLLTYIRPESAYFVSIISISHAQEIYAIALPSHTNTHLELKMSDSDTTYGPGLTESEFREALVRAKSLGDVPTTRSLLSQKPLPQWVNTTEELRQTTANAIAKAVEALDFEGARGFLLNWAGENPLDPFVPIELQLGLSRAVKAGNQEIVLLLLQNGARMNGFVEQAIFSPLKYNAETFKSIMDTLLEFGWDKIDLDSILR